MTQESDSKHRPQLTMHGALLEVFGLGILLIGESGVGKSECALDLVSRGHRLVSDDLVPIRKTADQRLLGFCTDPAYFMEIRGLGLLNIRDLFGISAVCPKTHIHLVLELVRWQEQAQYDRLGLEENKREILGVALDCATLPVGPGRNLATLVEVAARLRLQTAQGSRPARELVRRLRNKLEKRPPEKE